MTLGRRQRAEVEDGCLVSLFLVIFVATLMLGVGSCSSNAQTSTETGHIVDMYVKGGDGSKYFVVVNKDSDHQDEVFENRDALIPFGKTNSADVQQQARRLFENKAHVRVSLNGARWTLLSWFRNVLTIQEIP